MTKIEDQRLSALVEWVQDVLADPGVECAPASGDASFRRYFRFITQAGSWIGMDAPPAQEPLAPFLHVAERLAGIGLNVPLIHSRDERQGFLLISDLGSRQYLHALASGNHNQHVELYTDAINALVRLQSRGQVFAPELPAYDEALLIAEMALFPTWYLQGHLGIELDAAETRMWQQLVAALVQAAMAQPKVVVHRDYHSRNLMVTAENNPGILDFQDSVFGPITYDLVSLLEDCYIALPESMEHELIEFYRGRAKEFGIPITGRDEFMVSYDLMGVQRHLKAAGIFARLNHRDGKPAYMGDVPRTLAYIVRAAQRNDCCQPLADFLLRRVPAANAVELL